MKKYFLPIFTVIFINFADAQFITTNPATTPITLSAPVNVGGDLDMAAGKVIKFNTTPIIKYYGTSNIGFGANSGNLASTGTYNVLIGQNTGAISTSGNGNLFVGTNSGYSSNGNENTGLGAGSLAYNTGSYNLGMGGNSGSSNTGSYSNFLGYVAGRNNKGNANTFLGALASNDLAITGSDNMFLGNATFTPNLAINRSIALGYQASVDISDAITLGNTVAKIGIGTGSPTEKLHVNGTVRFENLPIDAPGAPATSYVVIDAAGKLFKYTGTAPARLGALEGNNASIPTSFTENWILKNDFLYNKNKKGIIIGEGITMLPKGYGMYVTEGILTEKVKVAIKNSSDWADYVFNKDYKKMSLAEVEKFILVNKHLPNMLSASEMITEGNDLAKTDAKLLEKIEELTLYMIDMKKENAQMKRQINSLKKKLK